MNSNSHAIAALLALGPTAAKYLEEYALTLKNPAHIRRVFKVSMDLQDAIDRLSDTHTAVI